MATGANTGMSRTIWQEQKITSFFCTAAFRKWQHNATSCQKSWLGAFCYDKTQVTISQDWTIETSKLTQKPCFVRAASPRPSCELAGELTEHSDTLRPLDSGLPRRSCGRMLKVSWASIKVEKEQETRDSRVQSNTWRASTHAHTYTREGGCRSKFQDRFTPGINMLSGCSDHKHRCS